MDVKIFFNPVNDKLHQNIESTHSFFKNIYLLGPSFPNIKKADIALIGLEEFRGAGYDNENDNGTDEIRAKLYNLKKGAIAYKIVDLGNLRNGPTLEETQTRLQEVCHFLLDNEVLPIVFGGTHDMDISLYKAYQDMEKLVSILNVDAFIDLGLF